MAPRKISLSNKRRQSSAKNGSNAKRCRQSTDQNEPTVVEDVSLQKRQNFYDDRDRYFQALDALLQMTENMKSESRLFNSLHNIFSTSKDLLYECVDSISKEIYSMIQFDEAGKETNATSLIKFDSPSLSIDVHPPIDFSPQATLKRRILSARCQGSVKNQVVSSNGNVAKKSSAQEQSTGKEVKCSDEQVTEAAELTIKNLILHNEKLAEPNEEGTKQATVNMSSNSVYSTVLCSSDKNGDRLVVCKRPLLRLVPVDGKLISVSSSSSVVHAGGQVNKNSDTQQLSPNSSSVNPDLDAKNQTSINPSTPKDDLIFSKPRDLIVSAKRYRGPSVTKLSASNDSVTCIVPKTQEKKVDSVDSLVLPDMPSVGVSSQGDKPSHFDNVDEGCEGGEINKSVSLKSEASKSPGDSLNFETSSSTCIAIKEEKTVSKVGPADSTSMITLKSSDRQKVLNDKKDEKMSIRSKIQGRRRSSVSLKVIEESSDITLISNTVTSSRPLKKTSIIEESASSVALLSTTLNNEPSLNASKLPRNKNKGSARTSNKRFKSSEEAEKNSEAKSVILSSNTNNLIADKLDPTRKGCEPLLPYTRENGSNHGVNKSDASYESIGSPQSESNPNLKQPVFPISCVANISNSDELGDINSATNLMQSKNCRENDPFGKDADLLSVGPLSPSNFVPAQVKKKKCKRVSRSASSGQELCSDLLETVNPKGFASKVNKNVIKTQNKEVDSKSKALLCIPSAKKLNNQRKENEDSKKKSSTSSSKWKVIPGDKPGKLSIKNVGKKVEKTNETKLIGSEVEEAGQTNIGLVSEKIETGKSPKTIKQTTSTGRRKSAKDRMTSEVYDNMREHINEIIEAVAMNHDVKSLGDEILATQNNVSTNLISDRFKVTADSAEMKLPKGNGKRCANVFEKDGRKLKRGNSSAASLPKSDGETLKKEVEGKPDEKAKSGDSKSSSTSSSGTSSSDSSSSGTSISDLSSFGSYSDSCLATGTMSVVRSDHSVPVASKKSLDKKRDVLNGLKTEEAQSNSERTKRISPGRVRRTSSSGKKVQSSAKDSGETGKLVESSRKSKESSITATRRGSFECFEKKRKEILKVPSSGKSESIAFRRVSSVKKCDDKGAQNSEKPKMKASSGKIAKKVITESFSSPLEPGNSHETKLSYTKSNVSPDPKMKSNRVLSLRDCPKTSSTERKPSHSSKSSTYQVGDHRGADFDESKQALFPSDADDDIINLNTSPIISDEEREHFGRNCDELQVQLQKWQAPNSSHETSHGVSLRPRQRGRSQSLLALDSQKDLGFENCSVEGDSGLRLEKQRRQSVSSLSNGVNIEFDGKEPRYGALDCKISLTRYDSEPTAFISTEAPEPFSKPEWKIDLFAELETLRKERLSLGGQIRLMCCMLCQRVDDEDVYCEILRGLCDFIYESRRQQPHFFIREIVLNVMENDKPDLSIGALMRPLWIISSNLIVRAYEDQNYKEAYELYDILTKEFQMDVLNRSVKLFDTKYSPTRFALLLIEVLATNYAANPIFKMMKKLNLYHLDSKRWQWASEESDVQHHRDTCKFIFRKLMDRRESKAAEEVAAENSLKLATIFIVSNSSCDVFKEIDVDIHEVFSRLFEFEMFKDINLASEHMAVMNLFRVKNILRGLVVAAARQNNLKHAVSIAHVAYMNRAYPQITFKNGEKDLVICLPSFFTDEELNPYLQYCFKTRISAIMKSKDESKILQNPEVASLSFKVDASIAPDDKYLFPFLKTDQSERLRVLPGKVVQLLKDLFNITAVKNRSVVSVDYQSFLDYKNADQSKPTA